MFDPPQTRIQLFIGFFLLKSSQASLFFASNCLPHKNSLKLIPLPYTQPFLNEPASLFNPQLSSYVIPALCLSFLSFSPQLMAPNPSFSLLLFLYNSSTTASVLAPFLSAPHRRPLFYPFPNPTPTLQLLINARCLSLFPNPTLLLLVDVRSISPDSHSCLSASHTRPLSYPFPPPFRSSYAPAP